jgi:pyridoxal phosphate enzyme (YggS family)
MILSAEAIKANLENIRSRIQAAALRSGRSETEVTLVGATKKVEPDMIQTAWAAGLNHFGENYLQEAKKKQAVLNAPVEWHFLGHLQRRKVKEVLEKFSLIHSLDRISLAQEINRRAGESGSMARVLIEVNLAREESKSGTREEDLAELVDLCQSLPHLSLEGLMTIPPFSPDPESSRPYFQRLRELRDKLSQTPGLPLKELSMGMSLDFEVGVEEGATLVRIGTALFGPRKE